MATIGGRMASVPGGRSSSDVAAGHCQREICVGWEMRGRGRRARDGEAIQSARRRAEAPPSSFPLASKAQEAEVTWRMSRQCTPVAGSWCQR
jgi:hypothetical protein